MPPPTRRRAAGGKRGGNRFPEQHNTVASDTCVTDGTQTIRAKRREPPRDRETIEGMRSLPFFPCSPGLLMLMFGITTLCHEHILPPCTRVAFDVPIIVVLTKKIKGE